MPPQILNISEQNIARLKKEKNMSSLVNKLLKEHYNLVNNPYEKWSDEDYEKYMQICEEGDKLWKAKLAIEAKYK